MGKKHFLHQSTHPFDAYPFEAFRHGTWHSVERLRIKDGAITTHIAIGDIVIEESIPMSNIRIRSRKATLSDCTCFIRPGLDICVLSTSQSAEDSGEEDTPEPEENPEPVWVDARITSIERKPHESKCECQFYVSLYVNQGSFTTKRTLSKEINMVQIDQISILQKLEKYPSESEHYRWNFSEDCSSRLVNKLFMGKFSSDLSWLLVASVQKQIVFDVRSIQNRIVYQIVYGDHEKFQHNCDKHSKAVNFRLDNGILTSVLVPFVEAITPEDGPTNSDIHEVENSSAYDVTDLRRSKRRFVQPERYLGCDGFLESDIDVARFRLYRTFREEYEEMPLALSVQDDHAFDSGKSFDYERRVNSFDLDFYKGFKRFKSTDAKLVVGNQIEHENHLAIVPVPAETGLVIHEEDPLNAETPFNNSGRIAETIPKRIYTNSSPRVHKKKIPEGDFTEFEGGFEGKGSHKKYERKNDYYICLEAENTNNGSTYRERPFQTGVYKELINRCLNNIESTINREQPEIIDQWKEFQAQNFMDQRDSHEVPSMSNEEESSEIDMLWKEMELSLAASYLLEDNENEFQAFNIDVPAETVKILRERGGQVCRHEYKLDEEIGICCQLCGFVSTEIKDVSPSFLQFSGWTTNKERHIEEDSNNKPEEDTSLDLFRIAASSSMPLSEGTDNVWALIPELKMKLRFHQKRAFEFLWRNIAGSISPTLMEPAAKNRGGCVISHAPGAGKTLLIISFLVSYLKLFPGSRPLVLAPKTTLYTWYKEVIKWDIPIPVYQIHGARTYRCKVLRQKLNLSAGVNQDVMHVLDCLEKIQRWLAHPSILLMGYTSFLTLTREDSKHAHRKYMSQVLRQCPGILILDEGHNPRSTKSRLRKGLMKVDTSLRILLSGTLFQNNFGEYFNTLCLARPSFVTEVLKELDPKFKRRKKGPQSRFSLENRARKFFIDKISKKIDSSVPEERMKVLNLLKNLTSGFIDVYEGGNCDKLPGLQCYTLMMKSTPLQGEILVKLQNQRPMYKGFPLELELLITLGSIHPWLIRTTSCATQYFTTEELDSLEKYKFDLKMGSKIRFVMSLVPRCLIRKEKVLIFCHNIAPINLFIEIFETFYGWKKGEDVLVLQGDLELFERGRVMDKFEEPGGSSKVLLASINACAEGISLTAASRVILLDSEWNPSKSKQAIARAFRPGQAKMVYVYQLLATGTLEEEKHSRTTWKEWVSSMIFSEELVEDPSHWQAEKIEDDVLREIVEEERGALFNMIMKNEKASNGVVRGKE